jgi:hypothetical protein
MSKPNKKRRIMVKARLTEISAVDKPAQADARMVLRKRDEQQQPAAQVAEPLSDTPPEVLAENLYSRVLSAAESVAKGYGSIYAHLTREDFQAAQQEYVRRHVRKGETEAQATLRLRDGPVVQQLDMAWRETQHMREVEKSAAFMKARHEGQLLQDAKPRLTSAGYVTKAALDEQLRQAAAETRRAGETDEQAYVRVLRENPALYDAYREAN